MASIASVTSDQTKIVRLGSLIMWTSTASASFSVVCHRRLGRLGIALFFCWLSSSAGNEATIKTREASPSSGLFLLGDGAAPD
jgi:hypothetical protein